MSDKTINELTELTEVSQTDELILYDVSETEGNPTKKVKVGNLLKDVYSTDEVKTNKVWIDGKPIYRKTVELTNPAVAWNTIDLTSSFPNLKSIINTSGLFVRSDGYTVQSYRISDNDRLSFVLSNKDSATPPVQNVQLNIISSFAVTKAYITVEYTKTTD